MLEPERVGRVIGKALANGANHILAITSETPCGGEREMQRYPNLEELLKKHLIQLRSEWERWPVYQTKEAAAWSLGGAFLLTYRYFNLCCKCGDKGRTVQIRHVVAVLNEEEENGVFTWWLSMQEVPAIQYIDCEHPVSPAVVGEALAMSGA